MHVHVCMHTMCVLVQVGVCQSTHKEVRKQLLGLGSGFPLH